MVSTKKTDSLLPPLSKSRLDLEADADLRAAIRQASSTSLAIGKALRRLEVAGHWKAFGCASAGEYAEIRGLSARNANVCRTLAIVLEKEPALDRQVGERPYEAVAALKPFLDDPALLKPGEDLAGLLEHRTTTALHRLARDRRREKGDTTRRHPVEIDLTDEGKANLERARALESQRLQKPISPAEAVETSLEQFVKRHDLKERPMPARRMADTRGRPGRPTAARVKWWLEVTYGGYCPMFWCVYCLLRQRAHIRWKASGGDQEARNLFPPCTPHHKLFDLGFLRVEERDGRRLIVNNYGFVMGEVFLPPPEIAPAEAGKGLFDHCLDEEHDECCAEAGGRTSSEAEALLAV